MMGYGYGAGWMLFWGLFLIAVVAWVVWSVTRGPRSHQERGPSSEEILKDRFARGEIEPEEYRARLQELRR
jgi:putative membrane protein